MRDGGAGDVGYISPGSRRSADSSGEDLPPTKAGFSCFLLCLPRAESPIQTWSLDSNHTVVTQQLSGTGFRSSLILNSFLNECSLEYR